MNVKGPVRLSQWQHPHVEQRRWVDPIPKQRHLQGSARPLRLHSDDFYSLGTFYPDIILADRYVFVSTKPVKPMPIRHPTRRIGIGPEIDVVQGVSPLELVQGRYDARGIKLDDVAGGLPSE